MLGFTHERDPKLIERPDMDNLMSLLAAWFGPGRQPPAYRSDPRRIALGKHDTKRLAQVAYTPSDCHWRHLARQQLVVACDPITGRPGGG